VEIIFDEAKEGNEVGSISDSRPRFLRMTTDNGRPTTFYVESSGIERGGCRNGCKSVFVL
jgi:hypothetical protein